MGLFLNLPLDSGLSFESGGGKRWVFFWNYSIHTALQRYLFLFLFCWFIFDCVMYLMLQYKSILGKIKMLHPWKNKGAILHPYLAITATFPEPLYNSPFFSVWKVAVVEWFEYNTKAELVECRRLGPASCSKGGNTIHSTNRYPVDQCRQRNCTIHLIARVTTAAPPPPPPIKK